MPRQDLKNILAQMQSFNIPGFDQMIDELRDPSLAPNADERQQAIAHNAMLLAERLQLMQKTFRINPDEVIDYMTNRSHFSEPEWKTMEQLRKDLDGYTKALASDIENEPVEEKARSTKPKRAKRNKPRNKMEGGRKGWIAS